VLRGPIVILHRIFPGLVDWRLNGGPARCGNASAEAEWYAGSRTRQVRARGTSWQAGRGR
jgi:hypothetical protein